MHARVSFYQLAEGGDIEDAVSGFDGSIGTVQQMEGNQGLMLLVDRDSGKAITITLWDTEESLQSTSEQADSVRKQAADAGGLSIQEVEQYEVVRDIGR
jgi:heme-degrading monooxygenase HmoA